MTNNTQQIKADVEKKMSYLLNNASYFCATVESERWDVNVDYSEDNLFDSLLIMNHVWQTVAIHSCRFATPQDAEQKMSKFRAAIIDCFGIDPAELARKILNKDIEDNGTETETNCVDQ